VVIVIPLRRIVPDQWVAYRCNECREDCINHVDDACTKYRECRQCFRITALDLEEERRPQVQR